MKVVLGAAVVSTAMLLGASSPIKNTRQEKEPVQTELMSKESAEALRLNFLQQTRQSVPTVHNPKLNATFKYFANNDEERVFATSFLNKVYGDLGTYMGSALVQNQIDYNMFLEFLDGNAEVLKKFPNGETLYKEALSGDLEKIKTKKDELKKWLNENFAKVYSQLFNQFNHKATAEETISALDEYVRINNQIFENRYWQVYTNPSEQFQLKQQNKYSNSIQQNSDLIAYKMYLADMSLFRNLLKSVGFKRGSREDLNMYHTYEWAFTTAVEPSVD